MKLTKKQLKKLQKLNIRIFKLERNIVNETIKIDKQLSNKQKDTNDLLDNYDIEAEISFFISGIMEPISTIEQNFKNISDYNSQLFYLQNHNDFFRKKGHPMNNDYHCWWFHCLYDHEYLSWKRMLEIKEISIDINVTYQYIK